MIKNQAIRIWVNRVISFLIGGLVLFIIVQINVVGGLEDRNTKLTKELEGIKFEPGRLLAQSNTYFEINDYNNAKRVLDNLFEKHPGSDETTKGKLLYIQIEKQQKDRDKKWNAAEKEIREDWTKKMIIELKEQWAKEKAQKEQDLNNNLDTEWNNSKAKIREEWEKKI